VKAFRSPDNPIITPDNVKPSRKDFEIIGVFNAGVTRFNEEVLLLLRVAERPIQKDPDNVLTSIFDIDKGQLIIKEFSKDNPEFDFSDPRLIITPDGTYLTSISHLRLARSKNGISFEIEDSPTIGPENEYELFGLEDPRISLIEGKYYIHYVGVGHFGVTTCLASTMDFNTFDRHGVIFCPDNKDAVIFPERVEGKYYALHRPVSPLFGKQEIWIAESPDLCCWGNHRCLMGPRAGCWDELKIGASAVPFRTEMGWLEVYHGVDKNNRYCLGAVLLDSQEPWKIISRTEEPIFKPEADYELNGFFGNVVFSCGLLCEDNKLKIYYGAADTVICYAEITLEDTIKALKL
jgi:predicted GH43/DUF377 family glycosyl hydrolase